MFAIRKCKAFLFPAFILFVLLFITGISWASPVKPDVAPGDVLVVFKRPEYAGSSKLGTLAEKVRLNSLAESYEARVAKTYSSLSETGGYSFALLHSDAKTETALMDELRNNPQVLGVSLNYKVHAFATPNDSYYSQLWGMHAISADKLWDEGFTGGSNVYVAVLDTGIASTHEDLAANFETNSYSRNF